MEVENEENFDELQENQNVVVRVPDRVLPRKSTRN